MTSPAASRERSQNIENIYPLSPMQEGLLFHSVAAPEAGVYVPQVVLHLSGNTDAGAMLAAWQQAISRHGVLRSSLHWEERDQPFQVVHRNAPFSWTELDWHDVDEVERATRLTALLASNRLEGFDLRRPPLLRVQWIDLGGDQFNLVFCYHHLIMDGWSASRLIDEVFRLYVRETGGDIPTLATPRPYADYIAWLKRQDRAAAQSFWQSYLADASPTRFVSHTNRTSTFARREWTVPISVNAALRRQCQRLGITFNTLLQGALGLLIASRTGTRDVIFGATVAGRPASLDGALNMVGLFINTLPVRVRLEPEQSIGAWLIALQSSHAAADQHAHLSLREIQQDRGALFDCLLVLESYPVSTDIGEGASFRLTGVTFDEWTHFPLSLMARAGDDGLRLTARYACDALDEDGIDRHLGELGRLLETMASQSEATLRNLLPDIVWHQRPVPVTSASVPGLAEAAPNGDYVAPATETEKILAAAWADVLKHPSPSSGDNFFTLGGHSLLAARVVSRVRRELAMELPVRSLFDRPVLADLAAYIDALRIGFTEPSLNDREIEI